MIKGLYKVLKAIVGKPLLWLFGMRIVGAENEPRYEAGSYLLCSNHLGAMDPVFIAAALKYRRLDFMAKKELFKYKLVGKFLGYFGAYPIDRSGADVGAVKGTIRMLQEGHSTAIFPQGTRCPRVHPSETKIKSGAGLIAVRAGVPVLPVLIRNRDWRIGLFHRTEIVFGELIRPEEYMPKTEGEHANYAEISRLIFDRICALEDVK